MQSKAFFSLILGISVLLAPVQAAGNVLIPLVTGGISGHTYARFWNKENYTKLAISWFLANMIKNSIFSKASEMDKLDSWITLATFLGFTMFKDDVEEALSQMTMDGKRVEIRGAKKVYISRDGEKVVAIDDHNNRYSL